MTFKVCIQATSSAAPKSFSALPPREREAGGPIRPPAPRLLHLLLCHAHCRGSEAEYWVEEIRPRLAFVLPPAPRCVWHVSPQGPHGFLGALSRGVIGCVCAGNGRVNVSVCARVHAVPAEGKRAYLVLAETWQRRNFWISGQTIRNGQGEQDCLGHQGPQDIGGSRAACGGSLPLGCGPYRVRV